MVKRLNVALEDSDFDAIDEVKDGFDMTDEKFVIEAAECLQVRDILNASIQGM